MDLGDTMERISNRYKIVLWSDLQSLDPRDRARLVLAYAEGISLYEGNDEVHAAGEMWDDNLVWSEEQILHDWKFNGWEDAQIADEKTRLDNEVETIHAAIDMTSKSAESSFKTIEEWLSPPDFEIRHEGEIIALTDNFVGIEGDNTFGIHNRYFLDRGKSERASVGERWSIHYRGAHGIQSELLPA